MIEIFLHPKPFMIESEEFSFFHEESLYSIHDFFTDIFSIDIRLSHARIVIGSPRDVGDESGIYWWSKDIYSLEKCLRSIAPESDCDTGDADDICLFLHTSRVSHHGSCMREHIHHFMVMSKCWAISKILSMRDTECFDIITEIVSIECGF